VGKPLLARNDHGREYKSLIYGYCVGVFFLAQDPEEVARGCGLSDVGGGKRTGLSNDLRLSEATPGGVARVVDQRLQIALRTGTMKLGMVAWTGAK